MLTYHAFRLEKVPGVDSCDVAGVPNVLVIRFKMQILIIKEKGDEQEWEELSGHVLAYGSRDDARQKAGCSRHAFHRMARDFFPCILQS